VSKGVGRFIGTLLGISAPLNESPSPMPPALSRLAADLLRRDFAFAELSSAEAELVASYMWDDTIAAETTFIREGDEADNDFLLLVLHGEATVENRSVGQSEASVMTVIGPGHVIGEMGLIDDEPRSATCVASTDMVVAVMTRDALRDLLHKHPATGNKLLLTISRRMAARLRETGRKLKTYAQLVRTMEADMENLEKQLGISNKLHRQQPKR
jgi:CRP/FNR family transcriptional regulator, cyclic AMP receptor protein